MLNTMVTTPPTIIMSGTIRNKVSEMAGKRHLQIADLAREAKVSYDTAKRIWTGEAKGISWDTLASFCEALGCDISDLFEYLPAKERDR